MRAVEASRKPHRPTARTLVLFAAIAATASCGGDGTTQPTPPPPPPPPPPPQATTIQVSPATAALDAISATTQLSAEVRDQNGQVMSGTTVTWSSGDATVATVDASGLVTAAGNGEATITASAGAATGAAVVTVTQAVASVEVTPAAVALTALGSRQQMSAQALDANANAVEGIEFSWMSSDAGVATVDASGLVTAAGNGEATITASAGEASGSAVVTVMQVVASVEVTPASSELAVGSTAQLTAEGFDENANAVEDAQFSWASSDAAVASVDVSGLVTGIDEGETTITASADGASGTAVVTVIQPLASVEVTPSEVGLSALGATVQLTAEGFDDDGNAVEGVRFSWKSSDAAIATVDASGLVTAAGNGEATITASAGGASGSAVVTVAQALVSLEVAPTEIGLSALGATEQLTAQGRDANGHEVAGAVFAWGSSDAAVATVDASGLVTAVDNGNATITASAGETSASATVTVKQVATSVRVIPSVADELPVGATEKLTAGARDANGHTVKGAVISWASSDDAVATVDGAGLVTGIDKGETTITASAGGASGSAAVTVTLPGRTFRDCDVCPLMVVVPQRTFTMGSPESEEGRDESEGPQHEVTIAYSLAVGVYEVTYDEWDACWEAGGCSWHQPAPLGRGKMPLGLSRVQFFEEYLPWLSERTGQSYRLLTEAEWEYVARAGSQTARYWGDSESDVDRYANSRLRADGYRWEAPVGSFLPNEFGLYDVLGNVWEWVQDCWHDSYDGAPTDGSAYVNAWPDDGCPQVAVYGGDPFPWGVIRGGGSETWPRDLRSAVRGRRTTQPFLGSGPGFRVARRLDDPEP